MASQSSAFDQPAARPQGPAQVPDGVATDGGSCGDLDTGQQEGNADSIQRRLKILTYNACGMGAEAVQDMVDLLSTLHGDLWDAVLIQEGPKHDTTQIDELINGHLLFTAPCEDRPRSVAILLHQRWAGSQPAFNPCNGRCAYLDLTIFGEWMRIITCHLPHSLASDAEITSLRLHLHLPA